jgi:oligoendopeptidase F
MNYTDTVIDMFTLAHEIGHAVHSYYTQQNQPFVYGSYTIFLAEIASTLNESLLTSYLLETTEDETMYKYLLAYRIEDFRNTLFRQVLFAEFEMITHEKVENNEPLTADVISDLYKDLLKKYFGDTLVIDEKMPYEWSRVPHFYSAFYVYQYATGFSSAMALSKQIKEEGEPARERYLNLLKSGSSDYSIELLKKAGVDMSSPKPVEDAMVVFESLVNKLEEALLKENLNINIWSTFCSYRKY